MSGSPRTPARAATSQQVADRAGVSRPTVSQVLNGRAALFAAETVDKVLRAADELDYRPSVAGRALARGRSDIVVLALPYVTYGPLLQDIVDGLSASLAERGYAALVHFAGSDHAATERLVDRLLPAAVADLGALTAAERDRLRERGAVVVGPGGAATNELAGELQAGHLADRGHTRLDFALIDDPRHDQYGPERLRGFARACARRGLAEPRTWHVPLDRDRARGVLEGALGADRPSAMGCYNDDVAATLAAAARDLGVRVPEDLALIGMDDTVSGRVAEPAITTLAADSRHAGEVFSAQLVAALDGADLLDAPEPAASFRLVRRGST